MVGQPLTMSRVRELEEIGEEEVFWRFLTEANTVGHFCKVLWGEKASKRALYRWLHREEGRFERWQEVLRQKAEDVAEEAFNIANEAKEDNVRSATLRAKYHQWYASKLDPNRWGDKQQLDVSHTHDFGEQFLQALKQKDEPIPLISAEVIEDDPENPGST